MDKIDEQVLFFLRISKSKYNNTLYINNQFYMNSQFKFHSKNFTSGQSDSSEGLITNLPLELSYSEDDGMHYKPIAITHSLYKNNNAYIFCVYCVNYDPKKYDSMSKTFSYKISWELINTFWRGKETEMLIILDANNIIEEFYKAAKKYKLTALSGKIHYDLDENLHNFEYIHQALNDPFMSIFHKEPNEYKKQNEFRFVIINPCKENHYLLQLELKNKVQFIRIPLREKKGILLEVTGLKFDNENKPINYSKINYRFID